MTICDKINTVGNALQDNLNDRGVDCTYGVGTGKSTLLDMANLINENNLLGIGDNVISITASRPYLLEDETTDLIISLKNGIGQPLQNKTVTISDGTNTYNGITNSNGEYTLYNITVTEDTTFTATYDTVSATCLVEYCSFADYCVTNNNNSSGYYTGSATTYSIDDTGLTVTATNGQLNFRDFNGTINVPFEVSFELLSNDITPRMYFYQASYGTAITSGTFYTSGNAPTIIRFKVESDKVTRYINNSSSVIADSLTVQSTASCRIGTASNVTGSIKYRNFKIKQL